VPYNGGWRLHSVSCLSRMRTPDNREFKYTRQAELASNVPAYACSRAIPLRRWWASRRGRAGR
jgi:hypothetical protein